MLLYRGTVMRAGTHSYLPFPTDLITVKTQIPPGGADPAHLTVFTPEAFQRRPRSVSFLRGGYAAILFLIVQAAQSRLNWPEVGHRNSAENPIFQ